MDPTGPDPAAAAVPTGLARPSPPEVPPRHWLGRAVPGLAALLLALLLVPAGALVALLNWPAALPWVLQQVPGLTVTGLEGTLGSGALRAKLVDWHLPAQAGDLHIQGLTAQGGRLRWAPHPGAWFGLQLTGLSAEKLQFKSGPPSATPLSAPSDLRLPLALQIDQLSIKQLQIDELPVIESLTAAGLSLAAEGGTLHRVTGLALDWQQTHLSGDLQVGSAAPLPLQVALQASRSAAAQATLGTAGRTTALGWTAKLQLRGPLAKLTAEARLQSLAPTGSSGSPGSPGSAPAATLDAQATLLPFAAWPLGALTLSTQQLDLAALLPGLPHTALSGSANVVSSGMDRPATLTATLDNQLPGTWDSGHLPLQRLVIQASTQPRQPDRLVLERFTLSLGDMPGTRGAAGQVSGQGLWADNSLALDLRVTDLQPARLHRQAAALVLGGPVLLKLSGLQATATAPATPAGPAVSVAAAGPEITLDTTLKGRLQDGSGQPVELRLTGSGNSRKFSISQARASAGKASVQAQLDAQQGPTGWRLRGKATLERFDPRPWWRGAEGSAWRRGPHSVDAQAEADLLWRGLPTATSAASGVPMPALERWLRAADGEARLNVSNSLVAGLPLAATVRLHSLGTGMQIDGQVELAGNRITVNGLRDAKPVADHWQAQLQAPALAALAPLGRLIAETAPDYAPFWPLTGQLAGELQADGRWPDTRTQGELRAQGLSTATAALQSATLGWQVGATADAPLTLKLQAQALAAGDNKLDALNVSLTGSLRSHSLHLRIDSPAKPPAWAENLLGPAGAGTRLQADGRGSWTAAAGATSEVNAAVKPDTKNGLQGLWRLQELSLQGGARDSQGGSRAWLSAKALAASLSLGPDGQALALVLAPGRVELLGTAINWREASWLAADPSAPAGTGQHNRLTVLAELERFDVAAAMARAQPAMGWGGQLTVTGKIDIRSAARFDADVVLERLSGDLSLTDELGATQALGVTDLRLALTAHDGLWQFAQGLAGLNIGAMAGAQVVRTTADRRFPPQNAALQGVLESNVANLGIWGAWVPPGWRLAGKLRTSASFGGTLGAPEIRGAMVGSGLAARNLLQGINLSDGELALTLAGDSAHIDKFSFKGGDGLLTLSGDAVLGATPSAHVHLVADHFRLLARIDRRLVASGKAELQLDAQRLKLDGNFTVDEGLLEISRGEAPALDADVQVRRASTAASAPAERAAAPALALPLRQAQIAVKIDLGQKLRLRGHGLDTGLRGELAVSSPQGRLALRGQVRTEGGTVAAYGQKLEIERGAVNFSGALDNPQLDVLAIRPNLDVRVGVLVVGPAQNPRIRLYSEPDMADYNKLSWLVLGRGPDGLGRSDSALLQSAALALLAGEGQGPTGALLEGIGLTDFSVRQSEGDTRETIVSLGKQLSRRWYVGYERSVNATTGTWQLIYRIAQRFTLRAQSGTENALDLIWSWRW